MHQYGEIERKHHMEWANILCERRVDVCGFVMVA